MGPIGDVLLNDKTLNVFTMIRNREGCLFSPLPFNILLEVLAKAIRQEKEKKNHPDEEGISRDFPGGPVAKTSHSQCREPRFGPWSGSWIPLCHN